MTQPPDQPTGLPPEQEAVRRLLADARHDGPTPPEVVARLDATLASLHAEREAAPARSTTAPVVDLAARRRRLTGMGLLAAAAVVVAGVAIGQGLPSVDGGDSGSAGSAADSDMSTSQRELGGAEDGGSGPGGGSDEETGPQTLKSTTPAPMAYPTLSSDDSDLDDELLSLRTEAYEAPAAGSSTSAEPQADCDLSGTGRGRRVLAQVDGVDGAVVFRRTDGATQRVDLYVCGDPGIVRTLTLPAP